MKKVTKKDWLQIRHNLIYIFSFRNLSNIFKNMTHTSVNPNQTNLLIKKRLQIQGHQRGI